jgi:Flp pilus assembly protein TadG
VRSLRICLSRGFEVILSIRSMFGPGSDRRRKTRRRSGQSLVEFAVLAPVVLALVGMATDTARLYFGWLNLESATRDAAQKIASDATYVDSTNAHYHDPFSACPSNSDAAIVLHAETGVTFTTKAGTSTCIATLTTCTGSSVTSSWAYNDGSGDGGAAGGSTTYPVATVRVVSCRPFKTIFTYPFLGPGSTWLLRSDRTISSIVGR